MRVFLAIIMAIASLVSTPATKTVQYDPIFTQWVQSNKLELDLLNVPKEGWKPFELPHLWRGEQHTAYYRGNLSFDGIGVTRIKFEAVNFYAKLWVNGKDAGSHLGGYLPFVFDVTKLLEIGDNEIILGAMDMNAGFKKKAIGKRPSSIDRNFPEQSIFLPIGSAFVLSGMWIPCKLERLPDTFIQKTWINTSVRNHQLNIRVDLLSPYTNPVEECKVEAWVEKLDGMKVLDCGSKNSDITKDGGKASFEIKWFNPQLWSPERASLYNLVVVLSKDEKKLHEIKERFGFRELWTHDGDFYLNGTRIFLRAVSKHLWSPNQQFDVSSYAKDVVSKAKYFNANILRLHANPYPEEFLKEADEQGLMIVNESAAWCFGTMYDLEGDVFWSNLRRTWDEHITRDYNHPSFLIASVENELMLTGGARRKNIEEKLAMLGNYVREQSGRLVMFEGDYDPKGSADIQNIHYPYEPSMHVTFPQDAYFLGDKFRTDIFPNKEIKWDRSKPMYVGEMLWLPSQIGSFSVTEGDKAFEDALLYRLHSKETLFPMYIQAMRELEISAFCPWNPYEDVRKEMNGVTNYEGPGEAVRNAFKPVKIFVKEYDVNHFTDEAIQRTLTTYNWSEEPKNLTLTWNLSCSTQHGVENFRLYPSQSKNVEIFLKLPSKKSDCMLKVELRSGEELIDLVESTIQVYEHSKEFPSFTLLGASQSMSERWQRAGIGHTLVVKTQDVKAGPVVIAPNSLQVDWLETLEKKGLQYVILMPQKPELLPMKSYGGTLKARDRTLNLDFTTLSWAKNIGLFERDSLLQYFAGDNIVSSGGFESTFMTPFVPLLSAGTSVKQLYGAVLLPGKGILTTVDIASKIDSEPRCALILEAFFKELAKTNPSRNLVTTRDKQKIFLNNLGFSEVKIIEWNEKLDKNPKVLYVQTHELNRISETTFKEILSDENSRIILDHPDSSDFSYLSMVFQIKFSLGKAQKQTGFKFNPTRAFEGVTRGQIATSTLFNYDHQNPRSSKPIGQTTIENVETLVGDVKWIIPKYICEIDSKIIINFADFTLHSNPLATVLLNLGCKTINTKRVISPLQEVKF